MDNESEQGALFEIDGPDEDGCVWICSGAGRDVWCRNLGPRDKVAEVLSQWLGQINAKAAKPVKFRGAIDGSYPP